MSDRYRGYGCIGRDRQLKTDNKYLQLESESFNSYIAGHESSSSYNETLEELVRHNFYKRNKTQKMKYIHRNECKRQCLQEEVLEAQVLIPRVTAVYDEALSSEKAKACQLQCEVSKLHLELETLGEKLQRTASTNTILKAQMTEKEDEMNDLQDQLKEAKIQLNKLRSECGVQTKQNQNLKMIIYFQDIDINIQHFNTNHFKTRSRTRHKQMQPSSGSFDQSFDQIDRLQDAMAHIKELESELRKIETELDRAIRVKAELEVQAKSDENRIKSLEKEIEEILHHCELHNYGERLIELKENHERRGKGTGKKEGKEQLNETKSHKEESLTSLTEKNTIERQGHHNKNAQDFISQEDVVQEQELKLMDEQLTIINLRGQVAKRHQTLKESLETIHKKDESIEGLNKLIKEMEERLFEQQNQLTEAFSKLKEKEAIIDDMTYERNLERKTNLDLEKRLTDNVEIIKELTSENNALKQRMMDFEKNIKQRDLEFEAAEEQAKAENSMVAENLESTQNKLKSENKINDLIKEMEKTLSEQQIKLNTTLSKLRENETKLNDMINEKDLEQQTRLDLEKKSRKSIDKVKTLTLENNDLKQRINKFERDIKQRDIKLKTFEEKSKAKEETETETASILREKDIQIAEVKDHLQQLFARLKETEAELEETKTRLSKAMSDRLKDNNPNIADLSDENRPVKLAERYSELYDNQWTDAFDFLSKSLDSEQTTIEALLEILQDITHFCIASACKQMEDLQGMIVFSNTSIGDIPVDVRLHLKNFRKALSKTAMRNLYENYISHLKQTAPDIRGASEIRPYVQECFEICWLMSIQDPPVVFAPVAEKGSILNTNIYKPYTSSGTHVEYTVWPAMLLHENGPILAKGIAQGRK